ncbi:hypothetical protein GRI89_07985 [Altererythrobacter salegens]|uniref:Sulfotransferase family protein n=1 Tax=Croceibacterium salegens TaxID=1737568 RepID=A0A6I4SWM0_9SPHN|nr:sulfotransferase family 2 domain-containing protein [Croceibacterium salegens]MXO59480.1 hypothetical protein [Croceibacterium salegens]
MPLWFSGGKKILFVHIPKTAGSALLDYLTRRFGNPMLARTNMDVPGGLITTPDHFTKKDLATCLDLASIDYSFAFVRDPMNRLVSEYRYQSGVSRASRLSFSSWAHLMIEAARREPRIYGNHLRPQVDFIPEGTEVFRYEQGFDQLISSLDRVLGVPGPKEGVPFINVSPKREALVSDRVANLVVNFYANDYLRFGYQSPIVNASNSMAALDKFKAFAIAPLLIAHQRRRWTSPARAIG